MTVEPMTPSDWSVVRAIYADSAALLRHSKVPADRVTPSGGVGAARAGESSGGQPLVLLFAQAQPGRAGVEFS